MKKILKFMLYLVLAVVAIALVAVLSIPLWFGSAVPPLANSVVPKMTCTEFSLGRAELNPYTGYFGLGAMRLGNPKGYSNPDALTLSNLVVDVDMSTLMGEYIHLEKISVNGVCVTYEVGGENNVANFIQLCYNLAGGKEEYERKRSKKKTEGESKVIIDHLILSDIKLKYGPVVLPLPTIELRDLGKKSDGMTMEEFGDQLWQAILKAAMATGEGAKALGTLLSDGLSGATNLVGAGVQAIKVDRAADAAAKGVGTALDAVGTGAGAAVDTVSGGAKTAADAAGKAVDAVGDGAKAAADAAGNAVNAVGDGAKKATDALKGLFN